MSRDKSAPPSATTVAEQAHAVLCRYLTSKRTNANLTIDRLAERLGVRPAEYARYETAASCDSMHVMPRPFGEKIAVALGLDDADTSALLALLDDVINKRRAARNPAPQAKGRTHKPGLPRFTQIIREHRLAADISQTELSQLLGLHRSAWANFENGYKGQRPTANTIDLIRRAGAILGMPDEAIADAVNDAREYAAAKQAPPKRPQSPYSHLRPAWCEYLIDLRMARGHTAAQAARMFGVTQQTYTGLETGTRVRNGERLPIIPKEETLLKIASAFNLTDREMARLRELAEQIAPKRDTRPWQQRLREARQARKMTTNQAAVLAGVTSGTYRDWERKEHGAADHDALRRFLPHIGITGQDADEFMALVPPDFPTARAPKQPTNPVGNLPAWSKFLTEKRLALGLYLAQVDEIVGQQSVVRRFELGGWQRSDGRLSVASSAWLDRIADALQMTSEERATLHNLADRERIATAAKGNAPLAAEVLVEARRALDIKQTDVAARVRDLPLPWREYEKGTPDALKSLADADVVERIITNLPVRPILATVLRGAALSFVYNMNEGDVPADHKPSDTTQARV